MPRPCLWRPCGRALNDKRRNKISAQTRHEEERDFYSIRCSPLEDLLDSDTPNSYATDEKTSRLKVIEPPRRSLVELVNFSLVVGQEVALTMFLLAAHRLIVREESTRSIGNRRELARETLLVVDHFGRESSIAMALVYATLLVIIYYNQKALNYQYDEKLQKDDDIRTIGSSIGSMSIQRKNTTQQMGSRRKKAMVRMTDAILLAAILRLSSGIIHTLTASYSSDTVYALSVSGMIIHLLTCDYKYANGISSDAGENVSTLHTFAHPRPAFLGGTVSLNALFFSTSLLVSRIESNATSYAFVSLVVTLFAFYPATRHNIAGRYPNTLCKCYFCCNI